MKTRLSNWREETNLFEVITGKMTDKEALKKVDEKKGIKNKVIINPKLSEAVKEMGGELLEIAEIDKEGDKEDPKQAQIASKQKRASMIKKQVLMKKLQAVRAGSEDIVAHYEPDGELIEDYETKKKKEVLSAMKRQGRKLSDKDKEKIADKVVKDKGDTSKSDDRYAYEEFEAAVEYFYAEGINEEGIDLIIEEVGLDDFVDFVDDSAELLTEERAARKMNVRTLKATQKKAAEIKASKKDVVKRGTPADTVARARAERSLKKPKLAKPAAKKQAPTPVKKAATAVKAARKATVAKAKKDFDGDGKVETPKSEHRGVRNKKITKAVAKAKPAQPKKPVSKDGLRAKIKSAYEAGVKRHRKATQPVRVFHKGMKAGAKKTVKFAKDVKKAVVGEELSNWRDELVLEGKCDECDCEGCGQNPCISCGEDHHELGEEKKKVSEAVKGEDTQRRKDDAADRKKGIGKLKSKKAGEDYAKWTMRRHPAQVDEAKVDTGTAAEKASARNKRNTPAGKDYKFDTSVFITRKPGESLDSARTRKRREAHSKKRGMKEDRALDIVRANIIKKHGKGAIYDPKNPPKPQPRPKAKPDTRTPEQKKKDQDHANVMARYGGEENYKAGRGLGT